MNDNRKIKDMSKTLRRIDSDKIEQELGGKKVFESKGGWMASLKRMMSKKLSNEKHSNT